MPDRHAMPIMGLSLKPDLEQAQRNWAAFWRGELRRPILQIIVPRPGCTPVRNPYLSLVDLCAASPGDPDRRPLHHQQEL